MPTFPPLESARDNTNPLVSGIRKDRGLLRLLAPATSAPASGVPRGPASIMGGRREPGGPSAPARGRVPFPQKGSMDPTKDRTHHEDLPDRRTACKWYGRCLDHALTSGWPGFECSRCGDYEADRLGPEESQAEIQGCTILWWAVEHPVEWWNMSLGRERTDHGFFEPVRGQSVHAVEAPRESSGTKCSTTF
jgi:hypothetical protein